MLPSTFNLQVARPHLPFYCLWSSENSSYLALELPIAAVQRECTEMVACQRKGVRTGGLCPVWLSHSAQKTCHREHSLYLRWTILTYTATCLYESYQRSQIQKVGRQSQLLREKWDLFTSVFNSPLHQFLTLKGLQIETGVNLYFNRGYTMQLQKHKML